jgi:putative membrane protein
LQAPEPERYSRVACAEIAMDEPSSTSRELKQQTAHIKRSTKAIEQSEAEQTYNADRRTVLAADRTVLAAERTYAAWIRTGLAALAGGIGAMALVRDILPKWVGRLTGTVLILFAALCFVAAVWREVRGVETIRHEDVHPIPKALLVPINAFLLLVALAALIGIWSA